MGAKPKGKHSRRLKSLLSPPCAQRFADGLYRARQEIAEEEEEEEKEEGYIVDDSVFYSYIMRKSKLITQPSNTLQSFP